MLLQPCPAYRDAQCSIYESRPQRCRLFECRQLKGVAAGEISFATALERIREVHRRVEHMNALLGRAGVTDPKKPLSKRCEKILAEPLDPSADLAATDLRKELTREMLELDAMLDTHFRVTAPGDRQPPPTPRPTAYVGTDSVLPSNVAR
ncbi:MAG: hypothetical protein QOD99_2907 [Chthoniobacter sp.]|nr:hypothetical protein [Chthoniobacter sp.]